MFGWRCLGKYPKKPSTRWFKVPFSSPNVGGHLTPWKGHLTIPKRSLWIARHYKISTPQKPLHHLESMIFPEFPDTGKGWYISCSSLPSNGDFIPRENIKTNPFQSIQTMDSRKKTWHDAGLLNLCLENPSFSFWLLFEGSSFLPAFFPLLEASGTSCSNKNLCPCNADNTKTHGRRQLCNLHWRKERSS